MTQAEAMSLTKGSKVKLTPQGIQAGMQGKAKTKYGTVAAKPCPPFYIISVRRDGQKTAYRYHIDFWALA